MNNHSSFQTETEFELPKGVRRLIPAHCIGGATMRLATAADEILPLRDPRVQQNEAYLAVDRSGARDHTTGHTLGRSHWNYRRPVRIRSRVPAASL